MKSEIQGKIARIDEGATVLIWVQRDKPAIYKNKQGRTTAINAAAAICVTPEAFDEIKKVVGDPMGKRCFTKDRFAYIQDRETKENKAGKGLSVIKFDDFVIFPNK